MNIYVFKIGRPAGNTRPLPVCVQAENLAGALEKAKAYPAVIGAKVETLIENEGFSLEVFALFERG